jgi:hypothetical protein
MNDALSNGPTSRPVSPDLTVPDSKIPDPKLPDPTANNTDRGLENDLENRLELLTRILCDTAPIDIADGAYLYCQTQDNQESSFLAAREILDRSLARRILVLKTAAKSGYPGFSEWCRALHSLEIEPQQIEAVTLEEPPSLNTLIEAEAIVRFAQQRGYGSLFIVSPPFHQCRAFMTAVTVALREYPALRLYSYAGVALPWEAEVTHSQGTLAAKRYELIQTETERIQKYQVKGDLASFTQVLNYLNQRPT